MAHVTGWSKLKPTARAALRRAAPKAWQALLTSHVILTGDRKLAETYGLGHLLPAASSKISADTAEAAPDLSQLMAAIAGLTPEDKATLLRALEKQVQGTPLSPQEQTEARQAFLRIAPKARAALARRMPSASALLRKTAGLS